MQLTFRRVTALLIKTPRVSLGRIARSVNRDPHTIARARMRGEHRRQPPADWERPIAKLALEHAKELEERAAVLRTLAEVLGDPKNSQG
jgi:IS30 family transposase